MTKDIGLDVQSPSEECDDINCPFHGNLSVRGQVLVGTVLSDDRDKTVTIQRKYERLIKKYQRYEKRQSKISAHNPPCINAKEGDVVKIAECHPLSKTKSFVVIEAGEQK